MRKNILGIVLGLSIVLSPNMAEAIIDPGSGLCVDTQAPVVVLIGDAEVTKVVDVPYKDLGVTVSDDCDSLVKEKVLTKGSVSFGIVGDYTLEYSASDDTGKVSSVVSRIVHIIPRMKQTITVSLPTKIYLEDKTLVVNASATSGYRLSMSMEANDVCAVDGTNIQLLKVGTCKFTLNQAGDESYYPADPLLTEFQIEEKPVVVTPVTTGGGGGGGATVTPTPTPEPVVTPAPTSGGGGGGALLPFLGGSQSNQANQNTQVTANNVTSTVTPDPGIVPSVLGVSTDDLSSVIKFVFKDQLKPGSKGQAVIELQKRLKAEGYFNEEPSGLYARKTVTAVRKYQKAHGIRTTGIVGPLTLAELNK